MKLDRIRCAICERTMDDVTMHRIAPANAPFVLFLCGTCLRLPPEHRRVKNLIRERMEWTPPGL